MTNQICIINCYFWGTGDCLSWRSKTNTIHHLPAGDDVHCVAVNQIYVVSFMFLCRPCLCLPSQFPIHTIGLVSKHVGWNEQSRPAADLSSARLASVQVQLKFSPAEENIPQSTSSVDWAPLSLSLSDLPPCTGKAVSIDFIRHRSVGLSVCLSCIPHIPEPPCLLSALPARPPPWSSFPLKH